MISGKGALSFIFYALWVMPSLQLSSRFSLHFRRLTTTQAIHDLRIPTCAVPNKVPKQVKYPAELFQHLKSGQNVFVQGGAMTPTTLVKHLYQYAINKDLTNIKTVHIHTEGEFPVNEESVKHRFRSISLFTGMFLTSVFDRHIFRWKLSQSYCLWSG